MESVLSKAQNNIVPIIEKLGYEVIDVEYKTVGADNNLTFFIYKEGKEGGIDLNDCQTVNDALDEPLSQLDITDGAPYTLNISSPGLDRPIISDRDYERNLGAEVEAFYAKADAKKKKTVGFLVSNNGETFTLEVKGKNTILAKTDIKLLRQHIKFN